MRVIGLIALLLAAGGYLATQVEVACDADGAEPIRWVRTADGWEKPDSWQTPESAAYQRTLHPLIVGLLQMFASLIALLLFPAGERGEEQVSSRRLEQSVAGTSSANAHFEEKKEGIHALKPARSYAS